MIGRAVEKPSLGVVRRLKRVLHTSLELPESAVITVTQLACLEDDCSPLETVFGLLQENASLRQFKIHKPTSAIDAEDLHRVCQEWGFLVSVSTIKNALNEV